MNIRKIKKVMKAKPTVEGAGVRLKRVFGHPEVPQFDPFLLMDDFHSDNPEDYMAGFPMHPHRGIETITYLISGVVAHRDSMGNRGRIAAGDIQWMTAGRGIVHEEMPEKSEPELWGFQLWANLPRTHKMMPPRYQEIESGSVPEVSPVKGVRIKVICGEVLGAKGPVREIITDPEYLDVSVEAGTVFESPVKLGYTVFVYVMTGEAVFDVDTVTHKPETLLLFGEGDHIRIKTHSSAVRFLLISGKPIGEPVAWSGPIVMNTDQEIDAALEEYRNGTFISSYDASSTEAAKPKAKTKFPNVLSFPDVWNRQERQIQKRKKIARSDVAEKMGPLEAETGFVKLHLFPSRLEAEMVGEILKQSEVPYLIQSEDIGIFGPGAATGPGGACMAVRKTDLDYAKRILSGLI